MRGFPRSRFDRLLVNFYALENPILGGFERLDEFLEVLEEHAGELMPTKVSGGGKRKRNYSRAAVRKALEEERKELPSMHLYLGRPSSPPVDFSLSLFQSEESSSFEFSMSELPLSFFQDPARGEERSRQLFSLLRAIALRYPARYAMASSSADWAFTYRQGEGTRLECDPLEHVYWMSLFGRDLVAQWGRERVLTTPAAHLEELPDGSVILLSRPTPGDFTSDEARIAQARALVHLRPELDFDAELATLRERSAALAPVEPRFDPDIAELLDFVVDSVGFFRRYREIARLNAYRPPEVSEWLPRDTAHGPDVEDPAAAVDQLLGLHAERLAALLHREVPEVMKEDPDALIAVDIHLWEYNYPGTFEDRREDLDNILVPAVGAWLGQVLVRNLGGRWVPRRNLDETQVVLGDRAWLPFLRARRYLRDRQSLIDFSLTQFYRAAERHLRSRAPDRA